MNPIWSSVATLAVAVIFYVYRGYLDIQFKKQRMMRERVAYMLWVMANGMERSGKTEVRELNGV